MAESENTYVKIGERGRLIERTATSPREHVNLKGTGWVLKGSKGAPTKKDETAQPLSKAERAALTDSVPTSVRAHAAAADAEADSAQGSTSRTAGSAGAAADAKSRAAANS